MHKCTNLDGGREGGDGPLCGRGGGRDDAVLALLVHDAAELADALRLGLRVVGDVHAVRELHARVPVAGAGREG